MSKISLLEEKMEFDEIGFREEIELMNIERQIKENQMENVQTFGFNTDALYNLVENKRV